MNKSKPTLGARPISSFFSKPKPSHNEEKANVSEHRRGNRVDEPLAVTSPLNAPNVAPEPFQPTVSQIEPLL